MKTNMQFNKLNIDLLNEANDEKIKELCNALNSDIRLRIYRQLCKKSMSVSEIAKLNDLTVSSSTFHTNLLEQAGLVEMLYTPSKKGNIRVCHLKATDILFFSDYPVIPSDENVLRYEMPVGMYTDANLEFVSGFCTDEEQYMFNNGDYFIPLRSKAQLLWCSSGFVTYTFPGFFGKNQRAQELIFSFEICSETVHYRNDWKSDISFSVNGREAAAYTSPADFGGRRGILNPAWWNDNATQYGQLKTLAINKEGVYIDGVLVNDRLRIGDLEIEKRRGLKLKIESKKDAEYCGGFNLFGKGFGDYYQDIIMTVVLE